MHIRIRQDATIHELNLESDKLEALQKVVSANITESSKKRIIKHITGETPCFSCGGIPTLEVRYPVKDGGATNIERYCKSCVSKVFAREQVL